MEITYMYSKIRRNYGKQPMFCEVAPHIIDSIEPLKAEQNKYCLRNPVNQASQATTNQSENYVNTKTVVTTEQGMNHAEGGWPKDVNNLDEEQTSRHRRRIERDDHYVKSVLDTCPKFTHAIKQNNAIELYEMYFKEMPSEVPVERSFIRLHNTYKDNKNRPVSTIGWTCDSYPRLVAGYCDKSFPILGSKNLELECYIWDLENPTEPFVFYPSFPCWVIACSPVESSIFLSGLSNGTVCIFDIRSKITPVMESPEHFAHRDPVTALLYMQSRLNNEFFSGSTDGKCMWWDIRNLSQPTDAMIMSTNVLQGQPINQGNSEGVTALQYERSLPTKFLCGTDTGYVINVNRKGKSHSEIMSGVYLAHRGPVKAVHRSPCASKMFLTCGDWTAHIWSEDIKSSPILTGMPHRYPITDICWATQRVSSYMTVSTDGILRCWDLLRKFDKPVVSLQISKCALLNVKPHEDGHLIASGDVAGNIYLLSASDSLSISGERDKTLILQMYDRETRREHILESRIKEIRLKIKAAEEEAGVIEKIVLDDAEVNLKTIEDDYKKSVQEEIKRMGVNTPLGGERRRKSLQKARKR